MKLKHLIWVLALILVVRANAQNENLEEIIADAPPLAKQTSEVEEKPQLNLFGNLNDKHLLLFGVRMDAAYNGGGVVAQGFSIPSVRLTAWGNAGDLISYRLSLGQTREFSSVLLPQILPVEAYIDLNSASALDWDSQSRLTFRMGLFTPTFNPWWTPDLADLPLPDYNETHRALFLSRDMGAEAIFEPIANHLSFHVGFFNGSGIFSLNTNNSKAFTAGVRGMFSVGSSKVQIGLSALSRQQADPTSVNFRSDIVTNLYASIEHPTGIKLSAEAYSGELNDSVRTAYPFGGAAILQLPVYRGIRLFTKAEILRNSGSGTGFIRNGQIGPVFELHKAVNAYVFYQYFDNGTSVENMGWLRIRLVL